jgi:hypothetical protein
MWHAEQDTGSPSINRILISVVARPLAARASEWRCPWQRLWGLPLTGLYPEAGLRIYPKR